MRNFFNTLVTRILLLFVEHFKEQLTPILDDLVAKAIPHIEETVTEEFNRMEQEIEDKVSNAVDEADIERDVERAINDTIEEANIEGKIEEAVNEYDIEGAVEEKMEEAVREYELDEEFEDKIKLLVKKHMRVVLAEMAQSVEEVEA